MSFEVIPQGNVQRLNARVLSAEPQMCFVLNQALPEDRLMGLMEAFYVFDVDVDGVERPVLVAGLYYKQGELDLLQDRYDAFVSDSEECYIGERQGQPSIDGYLLDKGLSPLQLEMLHETFQINQVEVDGEPRDALQVVYHQIFTEEELEKWHSQ